MLFGIDAGGRKITNKLGCLILERLAMEIYAFDNRIIYV
jgi:hypothetical protein